MCKKINALTLYVLTVTFCLSSSVALAQATSNIEILDTQFEPIAQGKNVVYVKVRNLSDKDQTFALHIQTRSPDYGPGIGWGRQFFKTIKAKDTRWIRCPFKIQGPITSGTWVRLQYYDPPSQSAFDFDKYFHKTFYTSKDLQQRATGPTQPLSKIEKEIVLKTFADIQEYLKRGNHKEVWDLFTKDYKDAEFHNRFEKFFKAAMKPASLQAKFVWNKLEFLELKPEDVTRRNGQLLVRATRGNETWTIIFDQVDGIWKVDWIAGYTPGLVREVLEAKK